MKRGILSIGIGLTVAVLTGCGTHGPVTNGGIPEAAAGQIGAKSSNGKAQTGTIMHMDKSNMPPAIAKKFGGGSSPN